MRVLITGASGRVSRLLVPQLAEHHRLRLTDVRPPPYPIDGAENAGAEVLLGDLADPAVAARLCDNVDAIVHLAGNPRPGDGWDLLRGPNVDAVTTIFDAASQAGVARIVLASSIHAMGGHYWRADEPGGPPVQDDRAPHPCCRYGATKVFAEAAARVYADAYPLSVVCLRLGGCLPAPPHRGWLDTWLGVTDLGQAVRRALQADIRFGTYTITSANPRQVFDLSAARNDLGYAPTQTSIACADGLPDGPSTMCRPQMRDRR
ncbi:NAD-dependent epimerase/dehydratase family protein [Micromonospora sp. CB01531]|uniref:NAD-dependent epimerase/dehydratase family protein n=1 Tax=Micromonospora sp. CB01531 TaxID=1718947 RepID=UPI000A84D8CD|nr:NAD(P)-dependent oxidoreductase [Micromonospora sp. CB01531]